MATIKSVTAGKLLQEFIKGYNDEPFGSQGLIITKQLIDIAFPEKKIEDIIVSNALQDLLNDTEAQFNFRNQPFFIAFTNFLIEKSSDELSKLSSTKLKQELVKLLDSDTSLPSFEIERATFDLSGNPESASLSRKSLEVALISTTASLLYHLLIGDKEHTGKIFHDLDNNIRMIAEKVARINPLIILLKELINYNWKDVSLMGCFPIIEELKVKDVCQFVEKQPFDYIKAIENKIIDKFDSKFLKPLLATINSCQSEADKQSSKFNLDMYLEYPYYSKIQNKVISDLKKLQSRIQSGKKVATKDFDSIKENLIKEFNKYVQKIQKEFQDFQKKVEPLLFNEPPWFKYYQKDTKWILESSDSLINQLKDLFTIEGAFFDQKKSKQLKQTISIFECLGGLHFALENIIAHYFFERVPFRLIKLVETPAKHQKIMELKFLQEKRYNEGLDTVREYLVENSEVIISTLLSQGFSLFKDYYIKENPNILVDEENFRNPYYLKLFDIPKDILNDKQLDSYFGSENFLFQDNENYISVSFHFKSIHGIGNDLFGSLVSSACLENAEIYKQATKIIGNFSGYVYTGAIGNMRVCPPALKEVGDLFV